MFDTLTGRLDGIFKKLRSRGKLHPKQVDNALADMRSLLFELRPAALEQDGRTFELLFVDDGSRDGTAARAAGSARESARSTSAAFSSRTADSMVSGSTEYSKLTCGVAAIVCTPSPTAVRAMPRLTPMSSAPSSRPGRMWE
jgi:hypothetical protein